MTTVEAPTPEASARTRSSAAIHLSGLRKSYGDVAVLDGVDLSVERGTLTALLGPNGAGKSTTIRILSTLLALDGGSATVNGVDVATDPHRVRQVIGLTSQDAAVDGILTGRENLVMMGRLFHLDRALARTRAQELLELFDLVAAGDRPAKSYSGGMRRKLDLAISLMAAPPLLFLDEPTTGLDPRSRQAMWDTIRKLLAGGTTILLTTQQLDEADALADRIAVINGGRIVAEGTSDALKRQVGTERLDLRFESGRLAEAALAVVGGIRVESARIAVALEQPGDVRQILNLLADAGLEPLTLELHRPTLDDVFLTLTATPAGDAR